MEREKAAAASEGNAFDAKFTRRPHKFQYVLLLNISQPSADPLNTSLDFCHLLSSIFITILNKGEYQAVEATYGAREEVWSRIFSHKDGTYFLLTCKVGVIYGTILLMNCCNHASNTLYTLYSGILGRSSTCLQQFEVG